MTTADALTHRHVEHCMGTVFTIDVREPGVSPKAVVDVIDWLHHVDATYSTYRIDSVVRRLRDGRMTRASVDNEVQTVLERCEELERETGGAFNAWPVGELDPSGYVKGWAIERAADLLAAAGSVNHCVNGGGDVQCHGFAAPGRPWSVGIADPARPGRLIARVEGSGAFAVATSGNAERGAHVVDPRSGQLADALASVTVIGTGLADVDAYATTAFAMGGEARRWLADRGLRSVVVDLDGAVNTTGQPLRD
ncbi:MAG: FAD:protein FMN transferase [Actinomycetota bacterium]|nr:FAD:protein FMN transferase [Actinomycetota bacterium]